MHQRVSGVTPEWRFCVVFLIQIFGPDFCAIVGLKTTQSTFRTEEVHMLSINRRCASWTGRIGELIGLIVLDTPKFFAVLDIKAAQPLFSGQFCRPAGAIFDLAGRFVVIGNEHFPISDCRARVSQSDRNSPFQG